MKFHKLTRIHQKELENSENLYIYIYILWGRRIWQPRPIPYQAQGPCQEGRNV